MRKLISLVFFISITIVTIAQKPGAVIDVFHYEFGLTLTDSSNNIRGQAIVDFSVLKETNAITLDLISKKSTGKGMSVTDVKDKDQSLTFTHNNDLLVINLSAKTGEKKSLVIQ